MRNAAFVQPKLLIQYSDYLTALKKNSDCPVDCVITFSHGVARPVSDCLKEEVHPDLFAVLAYLELLMQRYFQNIQQKHAKNLYDKNPRYMVFIQQCLESSAFLQGKILNQSLKIESLENDLAQILKIFSVAKRIGASLKIKGFEKTLRKFDLYFCDNLHTLLNLLELSQLSDSEKNFLNKYLQPDERRATLITKLKIADFPITQELCNQMKNFVSEWAQVMATAIGSKDGVAAVVYSQWFAQQYDSIVTKQCNALEDESFYEAAAHVRKPGPAVAKKPTVALKPTVPLKPPVALKPATHPKVTATPKKDQQIDGIIFQAKNYQSALIACKNMPDVLLLSVTQIFSDFKFFIGIDLVTYEEAITLENDVTALFAKAEFTLTQYLKEVEQRFSAISPTDQVGKFLQSATFLQGEALYENRLQHQDKLKEPLELNEVFKIFSKICLIPDDNKKTAVNQFALDFFDRLYAAMMILSKATALNASEKEFYDHYLTTQRTELLGKLNVNISYRSLLSTSFNVASQWSAVVTKVLGVDYQEMVKKCYPMSGKGNVSEEDESFYGEKPGNSAESDDEESFYKKNHKSSVSSGSSTPSKSVPPPLSTEAAPSKLVPPPLPTQAPPTKTTQKAPPILPERHSTTVITTGATVTTAAPFHVEQSILTKPKSIAPPPLVVSNSGSDSDSEEHYAKMHTIKKPAQPVKGAAKAPSLQEKTAPKLPEPNAMVELSSMPELTIPFQDEKARFLFSPVIFKKEFSFEQTVEGLMKCGGMEWAMHFIVFCADDPTDPEFYAQANRCLGHLALILFLERMQKEDFSLKSIIPNLDVDNFVFSLHSGLTPTLKNIVISKDEKDIVELLSVSVICVSRALLGFKLLGDKDLLESLVTQEITFRRIIKQKFSSNEKISTTSVFKTYYADEEKQKAFLKATLGDDLNPSVIYEKTKSALAQTTSIDAQLRSIIETTKEHRTRLYSKSIFSGTPDEVLAKLTKNSDLRIYIDFLASYAIRQDTSNLKNCAYANISLGLAGSTLFVGALFNHCKSHQVVIESLEKSYGKISSAFLLKEVAKNYETQDALSISELAFARSSAQESQPLTRLDYIAKILFFSTLHLGRANACLLEAEVPEYADWHAYMLTHRKELKALLESVIAHPNLQKNTFIDEFLKIIDEHGHVVGIPGSETEFDHNEYATLKELTAPTYVREQEQELLAKLAKQKASVPDSSRRSVTGKVSNLFGSLFNKGRSNAPKLLEEKDSEVDVLVANAANKPKRRGLFSGRSAESSKLTEAQQRVLSSAL